MDDTHSTPSPLPLPAPREWDAGPERLHAVPEPLTIRSAEDILAYLPHALGDWPEESLVAVALCDGQLGATLRIDLPSTTRPAVLDRLAGTVADYVRHDPRAIGTVLAVYTRTPWTDPARPPHAAVLDAVGEALEEVDLPILDAWIVGPEHWRTAHCTVLSCCPWPGAPTALLRTGRMSAEMVFRGSAYGGPPDLPSARTGQMPPAAIAAALESYRDDPDRWWDPYAFTAALAAWDDVLSAASVTDPDRLRLLGVTLVRPALRDAVMVSAAADAATAWRGSAATASLRVRRPTGTPPALPGGLSAAKVAAALECWWDGAGGDDDASTPPLTADETAVEAGGAVGASSPLFGSILLGATAWAPDWDRIARLDRVAQALAETEAPEVRAPALTVLAWVQWIRGRGGRCARLLERALSADPGYRLARLLKCVVEQGQLPPWARTPDTAWRRPTSTPDAA
jgi:hypothetical protein